MRSIGLARAESPESGIGHRPSESRVAMPYCWHSAVELYRTSAGAACATLAPSHLYKVLVAHRIENI